VVGALSSVLGVSGLNRVIQNSVKDIELQLLKNFALDQSELMSIAMWLVSTGAVLVRRRSGVAVNRYPDA